MTEWRTITEHPDYEVSDEGQVRNKLTGHILACPLNPRYRRFTVRTGTKQKQMYVHHLVAALFIGPRPPKMVVMHLDGDRSNNTVSNLKYGTQRENIQMADFSKRAKQPKCERGHFWCAGHVA